MPHCFLLSHYVYTLKKDRVEKEPIGLLVCLLLLGVMTVFRLPKSSQRFLTCFTELFPPFAVEYEDGLYLIGNAYKVYTACKCFIGVALVEEGLKFLVLFFVTRKNRNFNSLFDGLIYAVFVSLGFAALENVFYVLENGWINALMRAVMSVPGHMFFAVLMGYYYSFWHIYEKAKQQERTLKQAGVVSEDAVEFSGKTYFLLSLLIPVLAHGLYDYCCAIETTAATGVLCAFVVFLYIYCFKRIKNMSKHVMEDTTYSAAMILKKYPYLAMADTSENEKTLTNN